MFYDALNYIISNSTTIDCILLLMLLFDQCTKKLDQI